MSRGTDNVSLWARFSQQSRLVWARDAATHPAGRRCLRRGGADDASATPLPLVGKEATAEAVWQRAFEETYRAELRSEGLARAAELVGADLERYRRAHALARQSDRRSPGQRGRLRRGLAPAAAHQQAAQPRAAGEGDLHLRRRARLRAVEGEAALRRGAAGDGLAAAPSACCRRRCWPGGSIAAARSAETNSAPRGRAAKSSRDSGLVIRRRRSAPTGPRSGQAPGRPW